MLKAILFDCFGVLVEDGWGIIDAELKPSERQWRDMLTFSHQADKGLIELSDLEKEFAKILGVDKAVIASIITRQRKNYPLFSLIFDLKKSGLKTGIISNVASGFIEGLLSSDEQDLFDCLVLSSSLGYAKPDRRIYLEAAKLLGLEPEECLFIDDRQVNIAGAKKAGMQGYLYTNLEDFQEFITKKLKD